MANRDPTRSHEEHEEDLLNEDEVGEEIEADEDVPMEGIDEDDTVEGGGFEEAIQLQNDSIAHFDGHSDSVFTIASHPKQPLLVATGSGDDSVIVWSADPQPNVLPPAFAAGGAPANDEPGRASLKQIAQLKGHTDTIIATQFSKPDGQYLVSAGMDGRLRVYTTDFAGHAPTDEGAYRLATEVKEVDELSWLSICPNPDRPNTLAVGAGDGSVWIYEIVDQGSGKAELQMLQFYQHHVSPTTAGSWTAKGDLLATVSEESALYVLDPFGLAPAANPSVPVVALTAADQRFAVEGGLYSVAITPGGTLCAVAGAGGQIRVIGLPRTATDPATATAGSTQSQKGGQGARAKAGGGKQAGGSGQAGQFFASMSTGGDSVETLAFSPTGALLAAGDVDGNIRLFETGHGFAMRKHIEEAHENQAVVSLQWEASGIPPAVAAANPGAVSNVLYSCGNDGILRKWDGRAGSQIAEYKGHRGGGDGGGIMAFVLPKDDDGKLLAVTAGDDGVSLVFDVSA